MLPEILLVFWFPNSHAEFLSSVLVWVCDSCFSFSFLEQMFVYNTGLIPSRFYEVLGDRDKDGFKSLLLNGFLVISGTAFVSWIDFLAL